MPDQRGAISVDMRGLERRWQAGGVEMTRHADCILAGAQALGSGEPEGERHAAGDGFAMEQDVREAGLGLKGMAERVAEIEKSARTRRLAFVGGDPARLGGDAVGDPHRPRGGRGHSPRTRRRSRNRRSSHI